MFDYHMHTRVSFDGRDTGINMARAAHAAGLKEICFTEMERVDDTHRAIRFCTSWATTEENVKVVSAEPCVQRSRPPGAAEPQCAPAGR